MNAERFSQLAEAYGADARRWPQAEREAAEAFRRDRPDEAARLLAEADAVDALLDAAPRPAVSHALRERVLADAVRLKAGRPLFGFRPGRLVWLSGGAFAAAACAGVIAGQTLTAYLTADAQADAVLYQASMATLDDAEVLG